DRHPGRRHDAGLRRQVLSAGPPACRPERAGLPDRDAVRERPRARRLAQGDPDDGSGAALPEGPRVRAVARVRLLQLLAYSAVGLMGAAFAADPPSPNNFTINGRVINLTNDELSQFRRSWRENMSLQ